MKKIFTLFFALCIYQFSFTQALVASVEAETGTLAGNVLIGAQTSNSSGGYVYNFKDPADKVTVTLTMPNGGYYRLGIVYRGSSGDKWQDVYVNGVLFGNISFPSSTNFLETNAGAIFLNTGSNTITVQKSWGYTDIDKFNIYTTPPQVFNVTPNMVDPLATDAAKKLYSYILGQFGKKIISGQTAGDADFNYIKNLTGKTPLIRDYDMQPYSPMYSYSWDNNAINPSTGQPGYFAFGPDNSNPNVQNAINWYNNNGKKPIIDFQWHWHSPSGGTVGKNTFYTEFTTFDVTKAVIAGTQENTDAIRDIDAIAVQLKKLSDANVPILWRPLHEAGGTWFWWSAKGPEACKALWNIVYDRIVNFHGIHNLIWVWNGDDANWYPGDNKADIIGIDSYPGDHNYTINKGGFNKAYDITKGNKIIAMTENGPIPDIPNSLAYGTPWSFFMSWGDVWIGNSDAHLLEVYNNPDVITLENFNGTLAVSVTGFNVTAEGNKARIDWKTAAEQDNDHFDIERSANGAGFYHLATVKGSGNSSTPRNYFTYDDSPLKGSNYYRLVQYNTDGKPTYYGIKTVNFNTAGKPAVKAYPNPSKGAPGILLSNYESSSVSVAITDLQGKTIHLQTIPTLAGNGYYKISLANGIAAGMYMLHITGKDLNETVKLKIE